MHDATMFFQPWEDEVTSYRKLIDYISNTYDRWKARTHVFAWRGVVNSTWPFHSSLFRRLWWLDEKVVPDEPRLLARETDILKKAHRWGLHKAEQGRLSIMEQLAIMQHYGAPTRLIDVSFNPLIAAWFAVQQDPENDDADGRLFAVDVTDRRISELGDVYRKWEDRVDRPWVSDNEEIVTAAEWRTSLWAWKPPALVGRLSRQNAGFLFGGVPGAIVRPGAEAPFRVPKTRNPRDGKWTIREIRQNTSLALRFHTSQPKAGGVSEYGQPAYTVRIPASAKRRILDRLEGLYGYSAASLYSDYPGFGLFAAPDLPLRPPASPAPP